MAFEYWHNKQYNEASYWYYQQEPNVGCTRIVRGIFQNNAYSIKSCMGHNYGPEIAKFHRKLLLAQKEDAFKPQNHLHLLF